MNPARLSELTIQQGYRLLVEASSEIAWSADLEGRLTFLNRGVQRVLGYEPDELLGRPLGWIQPPDCAARDAALLGRVLAGATLADHETRALRRDGATVELGMDVSQDVTRGSAAERQRPAFCGRGPAAERGAHPGRGRPDHRRVAQELLGWDACSLDLYSPESNQVQDVLTMDSLDGGPPVDVPPAYTDDRARPDDRQGAARRRASSSCGGDAADAPTGSSPSGHRPPLALAACSCRSGTATGRPASSPSRATPRTPTASDDARHPPGAGRPLRRRARAPPDRERAAGEPGCSSPGPRRSRWS